MSDVTLPELGENIETVDVAAVLVSAGDVVRRDQPVIEVETEKASLEVPSTCDGRVTEIRVRKGDKVAVGDVILVVEASASADEGGGAKDAGEPGEAREAARSAGQAAEPAGTRTPVSAAVFAFPSPAGREEPAIGEPVAAAPSVRALARELGIDIREVPGSGPGGRITRDDVKAHARRLIQRPGAAAGHPAVEPALPEFTAWGKVSREPLGAVRRTTARRMAAAWHAVPHVTQFDHADITQLDAMRKRFNARPEAAEHKLTVTAIVLKLAAAALGRFPRFNASLDLAADQAVRKHCVHIGVAVDTERGLLVPVLRDANRKRLLQIAAELAELARRARERKLQPAEMQGASFTITNLGGLGTTYFSPIVNWPEVAILGVGRSEIRAIHEDGQFTPRLILPLSLSYDHRWIDGADAARFLRWLAEALEQPLLLLLDAPAE